MPSKKGPRSGSKKKKTITVQKSTVTEEGKTVVEIIPHKHCHNCGVSIPEDRETCSEKCKTEWEKMVSRKKFWAYLPFLGAAFLILLWILMNFAG